MIITAPLRYYETLLLSTLSEENNQLSIVKNWQEFPKQFIYLFRDLSYKHMSFRETEVSLKGKVTEKF